MHSSRLDMFGLEKEKKKVEKFHFDLEVEIAKNPSKGQELLQLAEKKVEELKTLLRAGGSNEDFDQYGMLLHGFSALQRVLKKVVNATKEKG